LSFEDSASIVGADFGQGPDIDDELEARTKAVFGGSQSTVAKLVLKLSFCGIERGLA
jgi:hypothetical protein